MSDNNRDAAPPLGLPVGVFLDPEINVFEAFKRGESVKGTRNGKVVLWHPDGVIEETEGPG